LYSEAKKVVEVTVQVQSASTVGEESEVGIPSPLNWKWNMFQL